MLELYIYLTVIRIFTKSRAKTSDLYLTSWHLQQTARNRDWSYVTVVISEMWNNFGYKRRRRSQILLPMDLLWLEMLANETTLCYFFFYKYIIIILIIFVCSDPILVITVFQTRFNAVTLQACQHNFFLFQTLFMISSNFCSFPFLWGGLLSVVCNIINIVIIYCLLLVFKAHFWILTHEIFMFLIFIVCYTFL